jgi:hypothetical protein
VGVLKDVRSIPLASQQPAVAISSANCATDEDRNTQVQMEGVTASTTKLGVVGCELTFHAGASREGSPANRTSLVTPPPCTQ